MISSVKNEIVNALKMFLNKLKATVVDNLASTSNNLPLSANQGRILNTNINNVSNNYNKLKTAINRRNYQIISVQHVELTTNTTIDVNARTTLSKTFTSVSGATHYYAFLRGSNWLTPGPATITGTKITCEFINQTNGKHSGGAYFYIIALKEVSAI